MKMLDPSRDKNEGRYRVVGRRARYVTPDLSYTTAARREGENTRCEDNKWDESK